VTAQRPPVLRPGDWVHYDDGEHQVVALSGTSVRLRAGDDGAESVVLVGYLLACPGFTVLDSGPPVELEPFGLLDSLPAEVLAAAREWERHVLEVETGLPPGAGPDPRPRPEYDPATRTLAQRDAAKAAEMAAAGRKVSARTVERMRARYARQRLWGLVDQRLIPGGWEATGRADARLVAAIQEQIAAETNTSTGTRSRLIRRVVKRLEEQYGPGVVPLPGKTTFYKLVGALSAGQYTFGSAVTRRQAANRPTGMFTPTFAARPGEQVQIDSTPLDVMVLLDNGMLVRADLTIVVDVATRTICAAVLRPVGTKAVDAALLLARMLVPEQMRPGWAAALRMSASRLPHARLVDLDTRMQLAAAKPVIVPDTIVIDHGKVFVSDTFTRACNSLGISIQPTRPGTGPDKGIVETTFGSINTLFCQHLAGYTGPNTTRRGRHVEADAVWTIPDLQDLLDEWVIAGWQTRPHEALRDPLRPRNVLSPNEKYAALVAAAGYLPLALSGADYLELLPVAWRAIRDDGVQIDYRTYDDPDLGPHRGQHSGIAARRGLWPVHHDPYDLSRVFIRTADGWVTAAWTHLPMVAAPFADFTWRHARRLAAAAGRDDTNQTEVARLLDDLLTRAQHGPVDRPDARVAARTRVGAAAHRPPLPEQPSVEPTGPVERVGAEVVPFGIFDADAEAERWI
jgi:putative transposase